MAAVNGDTTQDTTLDDVQSNQATMKVYGTNEPYIGNTVIIGGFEYTTVGGALEGTSLQLVEIQQSNGNNEDAQPTPIGSVPDEIGGVNNVTGVNTNPVVELFEAPNAPRYRRSDNNQLVPIGAPLHRHADDTIMTEHSMGPNDNSVIVYEVVDESVGDGTPVSQTQPPRTVPPLPNGTCPVGYNLIDGNCIHHTGMMGFGANTTLGGDGNGNTNQGGGGNYGN